MLQKLRNKLRRDRPFDSYADFTFTLSFDLTDTYSTRLLVKLSKESLLCNFVLYKPSTSQTINSSVVHSVCFFLWQAGALVHVYTDGSVLVTHGGTEMGQGLHTKMVQVSNNSYGEPNN